VSHQRKKYVRVATVLFHCTTIVCLAACGESDLNEPLSPADLAETQGLTQYVGTIEPMEESRVENVITYTFDSAQGPVCMRGDPYRMSVRDMPSRDLVIFLQGGGACWSEFCLAVTAAPSGVPAIDILNKDVSENPVAQWDVVYLPYCDGSFFAGDVRIDDNLNGNGPRHHRGLANLTAALEVSRRHFPNPTRILLAGSSGGAYGLLLGMPLVRYYYPEVELMVMADSGIGLAREGDAAYMDTILDEFNLRRFLPSDCPTCLAGGHLTGLVSYYLRVDPAVRMGMFSSWYDGVLSNTFLQIEPSVFADSLERRTGAIHAEFPHRFRRFIVAGTQHTSLLANASGIIGSDFTAVELPPDALGSLLGGGLVIGGLASTVIGDITMGAWLKGLVSDRPDQWPDLTDQRGEPPVVE
jgi:hypothetical protein